LAEQLDCRVKQRSVQNAVRYCEKCLAIKPCSSPWRSSLTVASSREVFRMQSDTAKSASPSSLIGRITVLSVRNVLSKWTITARGSTIASAFIITNFSSSSWATRSCTACGSPPPPSASSSASGFTGRRTLLLAHTSTKYFSSSLYRYFSP